MNSTLAADEPAFTGDRFVRGKPGSGRGEGRAVWDEGSQSEGGAICQRVFGGWAGFHDSLICAGSKGGGRDLTAGGECAEWSVDMTGPDGPILWNEILSRRWRSGKVVSERYSTAT